ncbi:hypothetical protein CWE09_01320 [Aliidiomarina minuta]|uniref:YqcC-like domain-containing protein n=1 Tax=Aliidiomarina minuta TaxID=880057 RepID=A0A432W5Q6_9GAMM|nr:YqcC family protein [Aliidiomarina minuta]RUO25404.1 hypothetical protein CWE09_01320 [Aliidiomarina minuta]
MHYQQTTIILQQLQDALKELSLWQPEQPSPEALQSTQPFAVDTLDFHQWLQFIMIPRMQNMVDKQQPLPTSIAISPMAVQVYKDSLDTHHELIRILRKLDILLSDQDPLAGDQDLGDDSR